MLFRSEGDWANPYLTMAYPAEAQIAREIMKFAETGQLYRGSKPVMWSVVEKTALAEAEVEYEDYTSDTVWVKFPIARCAVESPDNEDVTALAYNLVDWKASVVIWTTTPWTLPGNRAISFSDKIGYGVYHITDAPADNWAKKGDRLVLADKLAADVFKQARVTSFEKVADVPAQIIEGIVCTHPLKAAGGYDFDVPLLDGDHVTDDTGTGFVHTAPGHGREDFDIWMANARNLEARGISPAIPYTVDENGALTAHAPGFEGKRVITDKGDKGDANDAVIKALSANGNIIARGRLKHQYPHSWRSKKPVIFRNTPQWFIRMDEPVDTKELGGRTLREAALEAIEATTFYPAQGKNRIRSMVESRPDWLISRQRAWGAPLAMFVDKETNQPLHDPAVDKRIVDAIKAEGADAWFNRPVTDFLGAHDPERYEKVEDILDVWFDSGSTHAFTLEGSADLKWPADLYLEGSDQHRGWFHSSLLESCGTRGRAPYDGVLTHGFTLDEQGRKMSKSLGNITAPQSVCDQYGADILRLWVVGTDYTEDQRIGPEILKHQAEAYRRLRNTLRYLLGSLDGYSAAEKVETKDMPELERWVLHRLSELDAMFRKAVDDYDFHKIATELHNFCAVDLSAFYFDVRKDSIYCDAPASLRRRAARTAMAELFSFLTAWLAPITCFTAEEAWLARPTDVPDGAKDSVHLRVYPTVPAGWRDEALGEKWKTIRALRRVVTGALELERAEKRIGSSLQAAPHVHAAPEYVAALKGLDLREICITSGVHLAEGTAPAGAFTLADVPGVGVVPALASGNKCARCWQVLEEVGASAKHPLICQRCEEAVA